MTDIDRAVDVLRAGGLVAFPTETVYGLGADAANDHALERLYAVKGRPLGHPVIVHLARAAQLDDVALDVPDVARELAAACWPGPLTLVVRKLSEEVVSDVATGGRDTVGLRVPDHPVALALLDAFGGGVAAPSANRFGKVSPTTAAHVRADLGDDVEIVLDGGASRVGVESTIVDVTGAAPMILRVGGVTEARLAEIVGSPLARKTEGEVAAPGALPSHYAPNARVEIADDVDACARRLRAEGARVIFLNAPAADPDEYARVLYARLREADSPDVDVIVVPAPLDDGAMGSVVLDRLRRAAAR